MFVGGTCENYAGHQVGTCTTTDSPCQDMSPRLEANRPNVMTVYPEILQSSLRQCESQSAIGETENGLSGIMGQQLPLKELCRADIASEKSKLESLADADFGDAMSRAGRKLDQRFQQGNSDTAFEAQGQDPKFVEPVITNSKSGFVLKPPTRTSQSKQHNWNHLSHSSERKTANNDSMKYDGSAAQLLNRHNAPTQQDSNPKHPHLTLQLAQEDIPASLSSASIKEPKSDPHSISEILLLRTQLSTALKKAVRPCCHAQILFPNQSLCA